MTGIRFNYDALGIDECNWDRVRPPAFVDTVGRCSQPIIVGGHHINNGLDMKHAISVGHRRGLADVCYIAHRDSSLRGYTAIPQGFDYLEYTVRPEWSRPEYTSHIYRERNPYVVGKTVIDRLAPLQVNGQMDLIYTDDAFKMYITRIVDHAKNRYPENAKIFMFLSATRSKPVFRTQPHLKAVVNYLKKEAAFKKRYSGSLFRKVKEYGPVKKK